MSEEVLRVLMSELTLIRVICKKCETVFEVRADRLYTTFEHQQCPCCHVAFHAGGMPGMKDGKRVPNPFESLTDTLAWFHDVEDRVTIEFVVQKPTTPSE